MSTMRTPEDIQLLAARMALREYPVASYPIHGNDGTTEGDDNEEIRQAYYEALMEVLPTLYSAGDFILNELQELRGDRGKQARLREAELLLIKIKDIGA